MGSFPYQSHLDRVSRSFAFCIAQLEPGLREPVSLSYLLFRFLDTIEDSAWPDPSLQQNAFDQFLVQLKDPKRQIPWVSLFASADLKPAELKLIQESEALFLDFSRMPLAVQQIIRSGLENMNLGMRYFSQIKMRPTNLREFNQYCFYVAGIVGELLESLYVQIARPNNRPSKLVEAIHFGLFLQKINILKDQIQDEEEGRFWVHNREEVEFSIQENAFTSWVYLDSIPIKDRGYRLFCAWSLFLGLASFSKFHTAFKDKKFTKLSRVETLLLINKIESLIDHPEKLQLEFQKHTSTAFAHLKKFSKPHPPIKGLKPPEIMTKYQGQLSLEQMNELSLI